MDFEEVEKEISKYDTPYLVLTGGEPMVHPDFETFVKEISHSRRHITIETAGIRYIGGLACDLMSISPKLSNSGGPSEWFAAEEVKKLIAEYDYQLKFVVERPEDLDEIAMCLERLGAVEPYKVYLMPQAVGRSDYLQKAEWIAESCIRTGFSFSPRLQVMLWDGQRGR
jgi:7-carboxy-7-deazaguanine synthase